MLNLHNTVELKMFWVKEKLKRNGRIQKIHNQLKITYLKSGISKHRSSLQSHTESPYLNAFVEEDFIWGNNSIKFRA